MSSISGIVNINKEPINEAYLVLMQTTLNHWNADDTGLWHNQYASLGHLMLHNTPESLHEKLPFYTDNSKLCITADARIDNRDELFARLNIPHTIRAAMPDSMLILKAYESYGENCVKYLIGDFAFAIWDENNQRLFCARDHMGVKPFFYSLNNRFFAFASEKKGLLSLPGFDKTINKQFFYNQLIFPVLQDIDTTLYEKIKRLPPAHTLIVYTDGRPLKLTQYWTLDADSEIKLYSKEAYYEELLHHFNEAVKCRTRSHFTVGAELSGGMDSSAIAGAANVFLKNSGKFVTLSNTLPDGVTDENLISLDERKYIDAVIEFNQIKNFIYITNSVFSSPAEETDFYLYVNDGLERWNPMWQIPIKKAALHQDIRTLLSGFPGDEMVTYMGQYYFLDYLDKNQYLKYFLAPKKYPDFKKLEPFIPYKLRYGLHRIKVMLNLYDKWVNDATGVYNIPKEYLQKRTEFFWQDINYKEQFKSYRHTQKYRLLKAHVSQRMESESRYGLYFRTEPRFPMADIRLTQFYLSMPNHLKYDGVISRTTFRQTVKQYLPPIVLERDLKYGSIAPFLDLQKYDWNDRITHIQKASHPLIKNKAGALENINSKLKAREENPTAMSNERAKNNIPSLEVLKWLENNPDSI